MTQQVTITPEGDAVLNVYYKRIVYNLKFYYYRTSNNGTNQYATGSRAGKNVWGNANWGNGTPNQTYGTEYTETVENYTGHYFVLQAYYGEDISTRWPSYDQITGPAAPVSFIMMNGAGLKGNGLNDNGYGNGSDTIKGLITVMDKGILGKTNDINGNFLIIRFNTYNDWTYHIYYEAYDGKDLTGVTTKTINGKTYYLDHDVKSRSSNTYPAQQNPPQYQGFKVVENADGTEYFDNFGPSGTPQANTSGYNVYLNYYYDRLSYPINYMDGTYFDGNDNIIQNRQENPLHTSTDIMFDADIPQTYKDYTPTLPEGENGYVFEGWYADSACNTPYEFDKMPIGGIVVYAKWRQVEYRVFLHPNAGTDPNLDWGSESVSTSFRVPYGGKVSTPTGKRADSGYEFVGWYTDPSCSSEYLYNADIVLNDGTVTTTYGKTENTELDKWGNVIQGQEGVNADAERTWITRKLDLYAKWRKILEGAEGINVVYSRIDDDGNVGTNPPTDETLYPDEAEATAQAASTAPKNTNMTFKCWVVQKWNETEQKYEDTEITVLPGERFIVDEEYARKQEVAGEPGKYTYTMQLRAEYAAPEEGLPTHIWWFNNYPSDDTGRHAATRQDEGIGINEAVAIQPAPVREGYTFLGWARINDTVSESEPGAPATGKILDLGEDDLYLKYENGRYTLNDSSSLYYGRVVTQVAADERHPYHDMYAVWKKNIDVVIKKVDKDEPTKSLSGAKFRLLHKDDAGEYVDDLSAITNPTITNPTITNPIVVDESLVISGLPSGDYELIETEAPNGYIIQTNEIYFTVNTTASDRPIITPTTDKTSYVTIGAYTETAELTNDTLVIPNESGEALPMTGGPGTNLFTITGTAMIVGALMYGSVSRRRNERRSMG